MIFAEGLSGLDICFIRRTEREDDPWSGHVAFPGGRAEADDTSASAVAERETFEEIGMALQQSQRIGVLPVLPKIRRGLTLFPFIYFVDEATRSTAMVNAPEEVASVFWVPFSHLLDPQAVTQLEYSLDELPATFPGVQFNAHVIWGLTLHLVNSLAKLVNKSLSTFE